MRIQTQNMQMRKPLCIQQFTYLHIHLFAHLFAVPVNDIQYHFIFLQLWQVVK